jgi:hypothetical protein
LISPEVLSRVNTFVEHSREIFSKSPHLELDGTWPSIGVLDSLCFWLRTNPRLTSSQQSLISFTAAYLAILASQCWEKMGVEVEVGESAGGVFIKAKGNETRTGKLTPDGFFRVPVEQVLRDIIREPATPFPILTDFSRPIPFDSNLFSLFGIGLMTGLCPYGEGDWESETSESFKINIEIATAELARQAAKHYQRVFPTEPIGQQEELYTSGLIFAPLMMDEKFSAQRAVTSLLNFFKQKNLSKEQMQAVSRNLALSPDELISTAGFCFFVAIVDGALPPEILAVAERKGAFVALLREAMLLVRETLGLRSDWLLQEQLTEQDYLRFEVESLLGFQPWVRMSRKKLSMLDKNIEIRKLYLALSNLSMNEADTVLEDLITQNPADLDFRIQRLYLMLIGGERNAVESGLRSLLSEEDAESSPELFNLWGIFELGREHYSEALKHFKKAHNLVKRKDMLFPEIVYNLGHALIFNKELEAASNLYQGVTQFGFKPASLLCDYAYCLKTLEQQELFDTVSAKLLEITPTDPRVLANLVFA